MGIIGFIVVMFDIIAIMDIVKSSMDQTKKIIWALVVLLLPVVGMIAYFVIGREKPIAKM
jgi:hypothetical protein